MQTISRRSSKSPSPTPGDHSLMSHLVSPNALFVVLIVSNIQSQPDLERAATPIASDPGSEQASFSTIHSLASMATLAVPYASRRALMWTRAGEAAATEAVLRFGVEACGLDIAHRDWRFPVNRKQDNAWASAHRSFSAAAETLDVLSPDLLVDIATRSSTELRVPRRLRTFSEMAVIASEGFRATANDFAEAGADFPICNAFQHVGDIFGSFAYLADAVFADHPFAGEFSLRSRAITCDVVVNAVQAARRAFAGSAFEATTLYALDSLEVFLENTLVAWIDLYHNVEIGEYPPLEPTELMDYPTSLTHMRDHLELIVDGFAELADAYQWGYELGEREAQAGGNDHGSGSSSSSLSVQPADDGPSTRPPAYTALESAITDGELILHPPRGKSGGYKQFQGDAYTRTRLEMTLQFMRAYVLPARLGTDTVRGWHDASVHVAALNGRGTYTARRLRQWARAFIKDRTLPTNLYGTWSSSLLRHDGLANEIALHLQSVGKYAGPRHIHAFVNSDDTQSKFKLDRTISYRTACRWMHELGYRFKRTPRGQYADGHERADVVAYRDNVYLPVMREARDAQRVFDRDGELESEPVGRKPVVLWFHDETHFCANDRRQIRWVHRDEKAVPYAKTEGATLMIADFVSADYGWLRGHNGESAMVKFRAGKNREGYFTSADVLQQVCHFLAACFCFSSSSFE